LLGFFGFYGFYGLNVLLGIRGLVDVTNRDFGFSFPQFYLEGGEVLNSGVVLVLLV